MKLAVMWSFVLPLVASATALAKDPPLDNWVLLDGKTTHMSGTPADVKAARGLQKNGEALLLVRRGGKRWVIRDAAVLARVRAAWAPANEIGARMEPIGTKMSAVGDQQSALGERMSKIGEKMGALGQKMARSGLDDRERARIEKEMNRLSQEMEPLGVQMEVLGKTMQPFTDEMEKLGAEMERATDKASAEMTKIFDDALARGLAVEVK
jgi:hypothetical protein